MKKNRKKKWIEIFFKKAFIAWDRVYMESAKVWKLSLQLSYNAKFYKFREKNSKDFYRKTDLLQRNKIQTTIRCLISQVLC